MFLKAFEAKFALRHETLLVKLIQLKHILLSGT